MIYYEFMSKAVFAGSFDPPTYGHLDIIGRASAMFDSVDVAVAVNPDKRCLFSVEERLAMMSDLTAPFANVSAHRCDGLVVEYARSRGAAVLLRGVRGAGDFSYELDLAMLNRRLCRDVETLFIPSEQEHLVLRSSAVKELARFGGDISGMVPPAVAEALRVKFGLTKPINVI